MDTYLLLQLTYLTVLPSSLRDKCKQIFLTFVCQDYFHFHSYSLTAKRFEKIVFCYSLSLTKTIICNPSRHRNTTCTVWINCSVKKKIKCLKRRKFTSDTFNMAGLSLHQQQTISLLVYWSIEKLLPSYLCGKVVLKWYDFFSTDCDVLEEDTEVNR